MYPTSFLRLLCIPCLIAASSALSVQDGWYEFKPSSDPSPGVIGMQDWIEAPAGTHGRILRIGEKLYYNHQPIKLWGLNLCYGSCSPKQELADRRARFYPKYGINAVRLHKYADGPGWAGIQSEESFVKFDPAALERMDYQVAQFKEHGVYVKLSSTFGVKLGPADRTDVPYMDEFGAVDGPRLSTGHGSVFLSKELQDLQIQQIVNLLAHTNAHTGMRYADDPVVAVVELFNEDSALFFGTLGQLQSVPTLRRRASERFCEWLRTRYGDQEGLVKAWGAAALNSFTTEGFTGENLASNTIAPAGNPWFFDPTQLAGSQSSKIYRMRDTMLFLYELQNEFYARYVAAIRAAGYEGEILASNWQAGRMFSHYYNLHSDTLVGMIDRHNYFGGGQRGQFNHRTTLQVAGSAMLSAGMQQVADRPFMLSEWIHVFANEWGVEGPAVIGAYGMGLQGWDVSFMFQNSDDGTFSGALGEAWDVTAPQVLGVFPAVARQVLRGDVRESDQLAARFVHVPSLYEGRLGSEDQATQTHDVKTFDSDKIPARALAAIRSVVVFTDRELPTPAFDMSPFEHNGSIVSSTRQLRWHEGTNALDGYIEIDTPGTKAVVGFAEGEECVLGDVTIKPECRYAAIYVTAREPDASIATSTNLIIVALARARNTGMVLNDEENELLERGAAPIVLEPVKATITIRALEVTEVIALDHDGQLTERRVDVKNGEFMLDGARDATPYYLVRVSR
jgi:hypothetical protein